MNNMVRNNYRMGGYLLLALGLINWQYQNNDAGVATRSLLILMPGVVVIAMTFIKPLDAFMGSRVGMSLIAVVGAILVGLSFLN
ncbi:MAG: hypothetical protein O3A17_01000 [Actinomycetota bacterium]|jgi:hypothetical protein|uniref:hypothetical protein n=2 Tax=Candidatus Planktophila sp. TaxID=2175601 RepID=UPI0037ECEED6|nr:hypothetical protein [Actinomycetota bacterium]